MVDLFVDFGPDIAIIIFTFVGEDIRSIGSASRVNKQWNKNINGNEILWRKLCSLKYGKNLSPAWWGSQEDEPTDCSARRKYENALRSYSTSYGGGWTYRTIIPPNYLSISFKNNHEVIFQSEMKKHSIENLKSDIGEAISNGSVETLKLAVDAGLDLSNTQCWKNLGEYRREEMINFLHGRIPDPTLETINSSLSMLDYEDLWSSTKIVNFMLKPKTRKVKTEKVVEFFTFYMKRGFITLDSSLYKKGKAIELPKFVELMVKEGIDMNIGSDVDLPLVLAVRKCILPSAEILLKNGAKIPVINTIDRLSDQHFEVLEAISHLESVDNMYLFLKVFCKYRINLNASDGKRYPILHIVCYFTTLEAVSEKVNWKLVDEMGRNFLHYVKDSECVPVMVKKGVNINHQDKRGTTPLIQALRSNSYEVVKSLIENGADVNLCDKEGNSPISFACSTEIALLMMKKGAIIDEESKRKNTKLDVLQKKPVKALISKCIGILQSMMNEE